MDYQEVLRSIYLELADPIWEEAKVLLGSGGTPIQITVKGITLSVKKTIAVLPGYTAWDRCFVVETVSGEILTLLLNGKNERWIVYLRIQRDEELMKLFRDERKVRVNLPLKRVADFHGHICPDLIIGYKACELAFKTLGRERMDREGLVVVSQNVTSSVDAIQVLTGCTLGNRGLQIEDWGRHIYQFILQRSGLCLEMKLKILPLPQPKMDLMERLEERIMNGKATLDELVSHQMLLDELLKELLRLEPEDLFLYSTSPSPPVVKPIKTSIKMCRTCHSMVAKYGLVRTPEGPICRRCLAEKSLGFPKN